MQNTLERDFIARIAAMALTEERDDALAPDHMLDDLICEARSIADPEANLKETMLSEHYQIGRLAAFGARDAHEDIPDADLASPEMMRMAYEVHAQGEENEAVFPCDYAALTALQRYDYANGYQDALREIWRTK
jgi:hypothetical protein